MLKEFSYLAPKDTEHLLNTLSAHAGKYCILAGGTDILVNIRSGISSPEYLVDIKKIKSFSSLALDAETGLVIGANVTYNDLIRNPDVRKRYPVLVETAGKVGSPQLRNRGTIVGNICTASPAADMSRSLLCLGAEVRLISKGNIRTLKLTDFFTGVKKTSLQAGEVVESIHVPIGMADAVFGDEKLKRIKGHDLAQAGVTVVKKDGILRVAISSCATVPVLLKEFKSTEKAEAVCREAEKSISPIDDIRASKEYRIHMVKAYIRRIMERI